MLLMQLKGVNNEQILCTVQYTVLFSKYIVLETLACLITFIYTGCVETISVKWFAADANVNNKMIKFGELVNFYTSWYKHHPVCLCKMLWLFQDKIQVQIQNK